MPHSGAVVLGPVGIRMGDRCRSHERKHLSTAIKGGTAGGGQPGHRLRGRSRRTAVAPDHPPRPGRCRPVARMVRLAVRAAMAANNPPVLAVAEPVPGRGTYNSPSGSNLKQPAGVTGATSRLRGHAWFGHELANPARSDLRRRDRGRIGGALAGDQEDADGRGQAASLRRDRAPGVAAPRGVPWPPAGRGADGRAPWHTRWRDVRFDDLDLMRGVWHPTAQYPAEPLKTATSQTPVPFGQVLALELATHIATFGRTPMTAHEPPSTTR